MVKKGEFKTRLFCLKFISSTPPQVLFPFLTIFSKYRLQVTIQEFSFSAQVFLKADWLFSNQLRTQNNFRAKALGDNYGEKES